MTFSNTEIALLKELQFRQEWSSIIKKLNVRISTDYKEGKNERDWVYDSGRNYENDRIFKLLTLNEVSK